MISNIDYITPNAFEKYLSNNGWEKDISSSNSEIMVFYHLFYADIQLVIPTTRKNADYWTMVFDLVMRLSAFENRSENAIIDAILA